MNSGTEQALQSFSTDWNNYDWVVTPFTERIANAFKTHYLLFWIFVGVALSLSHLVIILRYEGLELHILWPNIAFSILPSVIIISNIYFSKLLERFSPSLFMILSWDHDKILDWYTNELKHIFSDKYMILFGLLLSIILTPIAYYGPISPINYLPKISFTIIIFAVTFSGGGMFYSLFRIIIMLDKLGKTNAVRVSIYQHPLTSIKAIGFLMMKISFITLAIYLLGISFTLPCKQTYTTIICTLIFGITTITIFIWPQIKIHNIMSKVKHERLISFSKYLENALQDVTVNPSESNISQVRELFAIQNSLNDMNEWPFNTKMLISILTGIAVPIVAVLIQAFCSNLTIKP